MNSERGLKTLFQHREPRLLLIGQGVSQFGDGVANVALAILVLDTTRSPSGLAWVMAARLIPMILLLLFGGVIVDRHSRRSLMLLSDATRAVLMVMVTVLIVTHALRFWHLLFFSALFGVFDSFFTPATRAITPEIVPESLLTSMNSAESMSNSLVQGMIGPAVGGLVAAVSTALAMGIDAATFFVSTTALLLMRATPKPTTHEDRTMWSDIRGGLTFLARTRWFWTSLSAVTLMNALVITPLFVLLPYFLRVDLHLAKPWVGYAFAMEGIAGFFSGLFLAQRKPPRRRVRAMWGYWVATSMTGVVVAWATNFWTFMIFPVCIGVGVVAGNVIWQSMMQTEVPTEMMGRASSVDWLLSLGMSPIGVVVASALVGAVGFRSYFAVASVLFALPGLWIIISPRINEIDAGR